MPLTHLATRRAFHASTFALALTLAGCAAPPGKAPDRTQVTAPTAQPQPEPPGRVIFLGFALHSQAKAFRNDVLLAEKLASSIDPKALRIKMANPAPGQPADWPQATVENFTLAMNKTAEVARPQDRVLVFIAAHSNPGVLNVMVDGKHRHPITPQILSDALAPLAARQVPTLVVLSACYSGAFVEPLKAPHRVVLTATDARSASFRCQYPGEYTPFAEALFGQAAIGLPVTAWMAAAQQAVAAQEQRRKLPPSKPQIFVGDEARGWASQPLGQWLAAPR
ncbi:MAG: C13 family peptidase [Acidovorax sp.]|uniref:C13 family peptidase n=1 Tax=Acidovorax sp. TaxID=1872122 RepID=UPI0039E58CAF